MNFLDDVPDLEQASAVVPVIIETPAGSRVQYEVDASTGLIRCKRVLSYAIHYPGNYGFVPRTLAEDGTGVDVLVVGDEPFVPGCLIRGRVLGVLRMFEAGRADDKVIAVHADDPAFADYDRLETLPQYRMAVVDRFFRDYRETLARGGTTVGPFADRDEALRIIDDGILRYRMASGAAR